MGNPFGREEREGLDIEEMLGVISRMDQKARPGLRP